jgi:protein-tyrosine phosphatase
LLYRSVALVELDDEAVRFLDQLGLRTVFDLRTAAERARSPSVRIAGTRSVALDVLADSREVDPSVMFDLMQDPPRASLAMAHGGTERFYRATYRELVALPSARAAFAKLFRSLAEEGVSPALVHCTTGKDRTGWAVAVLLLFLGVPEGPVMAEYLRSDAEIRTAFAWFVEDFVARGGERAAIEPLMSVQPGFLREALDAMEAGYGSVDRYLTAGLGLEAETLEALAATFLEPA